MSTDTPGFQGDEQLVEPTPIVSVPDLGPRVRRARRRRQLIVLWVFVSALLLGQAGAALYLRRRTRSAQAKVPRELVTKIALAPTARPTPPRPSTAPATQHARAATQPATRGAASAPASAPAVATTDDEPETAKKAPDRRSKKKKARRTAKRPKRAAKKKRVAVAAPSPAPPPIQGTSDDVTVPPQVTGSAGKGARLFRMGCGLCHGQRTKAINPGQFSPAQWKRYFAAGVHGRHDKLRAHFTRAELADVKAYVISAAR